MEATLMNGELWFAAGATYSEDGRSICGLQLSTRYGLDFILATQRSFGKR